MLRKRAVRWLFSASLAAFSSSAIATDETSIVLAEGEGRNRVQAACSMCHSLDYIVINSPFQDRPGWEKSVRKMVSVMGAPLTDEDIVVIVEYLARHYGDPLTASPDPEAPP